MAAPPAINDSNASFTWGSRDEGVLTYPGGGCVMGGLSATWLHIYAWNLGMCYLRSPPPSSAGDLWLPAGRRGTKE